MKSKQLICLTLSTVLMMPTYSYASSNDDDYNRNISQPSISPYYFDDNRNVSVSSAAAYVPEDDSDDEDNENFSQSSIPSSDDADNRNVSVSSAAAYVPEDDSDDENNENFSQPSVPPSDDADNRNVSVSSAAAYVPEDDSDDEDNENFSQPSIPSSSGDTQNESMSLAALVPQVDSEVKDGRIESELSDIDTLKSELNRAIEVGDVEKTKLLVEQIGVENLDLNQLLHDVTNFYCGIGQHNNQLEMVKLFVEKGADVNAKDEIEHTPLLNAVRDAKFEVIKYLVEHDADVNAKDDIGNTALSFALTREDDVKMAQFLLDNGAVESLSVKDYHGEKPLQCCRYKIAMKLVEYLSSRGIKVNAEDMPAENTSLIEAVFHGEVEEVKKIMQGDTGSLRVCMDNGSTLLHIAAYKNDLKMVEQILTNPTFKAAMINAKDSAGHTPLYEAVNCLLSNYEARHIYNYLWWVKRCGKCGKNDTPKTVADYFYYRFRCSQFRYFTGNADETHAVIKAIWEQNLELVRLLIDNGAEVTKEIIDITEGTSFQAMRDLLEISPHFQNANAKALKEAVRTGNIEEAQKCINECDNRECVLNDLLLYYITKNCDGFKSDKPIQMAKLLLDNGADANAKDGLGRTPLWYVLLSDKHNIGLADLLVEHGADVNAKDGSGGTPLLRAVAWNRPNVIRYLLNHNALVTNDIKNHAKRSLRREIIDLLEESYDSQRRTLRNAIFTGNVEKAKTYILEHENIKPILSDLLFDIIEDYGLLRSYNGVRMVELFLNNGADANAKDKSGNTPLICVSSGDARNMICDIRQMDIDLATLLIKHGADVNVRDRLGNTPLHYAVIMNKPAMLEYLLENRANPNLTNARGDTSLHDVVLCSDISSYTQQKMVGSLIKHGANVNAKNAHGDTPLHYAVRQLSRYGDQDIVDILLRHDADWCAQNNSGITPWQLYDKKFAS